MYIHYDSQNKIKKNNSTFQKIISHISDGSTVLMFH